MIYQTARDRHLNRIRLLGSDHKQYTYCFVVSEKVDAEMRLGSVRTAMDWTLQRYHCARSRDLTLHSRDIVPLPSTDGLWMQRTPVDSLSISHMFYGYNNPGGGMHRSSSEIYYTYTSEARTSKETAYESAVARTSDQAIAEFLFGGADSAAQAYAARKAFSSQCGINAALQYLVCSSAPSPEQVSYSSQKDSMYYSDLRPRISVDGLKLCERPAAAVRMTRSIMATIGETLLLGSTCVSMGCALDAGSFSFFCDSVGYTNVRLFQSSAYVLCP